MSRGVTSSRLSVQSKPYAHTVCHTACAQHYTLKMMKAVDGSIPPASPLASWMALDQVTMGAKVELGSGTFNMTAPRVVG